MSEVQKEDRLTGPSVLEWITGPAHKPLRLSEREEFKIDVYFDHSCWSARLDTQCAYPSLAPAPKHFLFQQHPSGAMICTSVLREALHCGGVQQGVSYGSQTHLFKGQKAARVSTVSATGHLST